MSGRLSRFREHLSGFNGTGQNLVESSQDFLDNFSMTTMSNSWWLIGLVGGLILNGQVSLAQSSTSAPRTGKAAASKYFADRKKVDPQAPVLVQDSDEGDEEPSRSPAQAGGPRVLALHLGTYFDEDIYKWGGKANKEAGKLTTGVTYRIGEWVNSMDLYLRVDFNSYQLNEGKALKMSLMPVVSFPDANSDFPLYFGAGAGLGIYIKQIDDEGSLSFDYQLLAGVRFFELFGDAGLTVEAGLKNHIHLLSDGQYNGVFVAVGTVFNF